MDAAGYELLSRLACPLCGGDRGSSVLAVLESRPGSGTAIVRAQCIRCHLFWSFELAVVDAEAAGWEESGALDPVSTDEVLDAHLVLRDYEGPLAGLFD
jgi:hypothetical protein